jgi:phosphoglycerate dehydrogenase-like enzyme
VSPVVVGTTVRLRPEQRQAIEEVGPVRLVGPEGWPDILPEAEVLFAFDVTEADLERAVRLKWLQILSAGADRLPQAALRARGIRVTNVAGIHTEALSEHALLLMLALARRLPAAVRLMDARRWDQEPFRRLGTLAGKTALVVGYGAVGQGLVRRLEALDMTVRVVSRRPRRDGDIVVEGLDALDARLAEADWIILTLALTPETRGLFDAARLARVKPGARLVNVARGAIVDQDALVAALRAGRLAGAGLDVTSAEPLDPGHPLWTLSEVIITPHVGGRQEHYIDRAVAVFRENLRRYLAGEPFAREVDLIRGY